MAFGREKKAAVERTRHTYGIQGQIMAINFREKFSKGFMLFPLRSEAVLKMTQTKVIIVP